MTTKLPTGIALTKSGNYAARAFLNGKLVRVGTFPTLQEAVDERAKATKGVMDPVFKPNHMIKARKINERYVYVVYVSGHPTVAYYDINKAINDCSRISE